MSEELETETKKGSKNGAFLVIFVVIAIVFSMVGSMTTILWYGGKLSFLPSSPIAQSIKSNESGGAIKITNNKGSSEDTIILVADKVSGSVVKIDILQTTNRGIRTVGYGSGFVVSPDGFIITNNHVVEKSDSLKVTFKDGKTYEGKIIGTDPISDLAVIKIKETNLPYLKMANSDEVKVGMSVVAIGNPYGYEYTVTTGVVSGVQREISKPQESSVPEESPYDFDFGFPFGNSIPFQQQRQQTKATIPMVGIIQTDAAINPGNSGGPLVNLNGEVIGVNFLITAEGYGLGFAISSNTVSKVKNDLIEFGKVAWPSLGITITANNASVAQELDLRISEGTVVVAVPVGNARNAGIKKNDVILGVDGKKMLVPEQIITYIRSKNVGDIVKVEIDRNGKNMILDVKLQELNVNQ